MSHSHFFVERFRNSSPYIHAHRGKTFVISFGGEAISAPGFDSHVHDFSLLNSLGIKLVLVHGIRPQIEARLQQQQLRSHYHHDLRITDDRALHCVKEAAGTVRVELEALLSMGLPNSPMAGAKIRVISGNFVVARPLGVHDGVDFKHTGVVRKIETTAITEALNRNNIVLISPIGYSPSGEVFNLSAEQVATATATALKADKLILLTEQDLSDSLSGQALQQMTTDEAQTALNQNEIAPELIHHLQAAINASNNGVARSHLINRKQEGVLLQELFTREGAGALISATPYETLRTATIHDINGILELIAPLQQSNTLIARSREELEIDIDEYTVTERDGLIVGCAALHTFDEPHSGELACLALHPDYRGDGQGERLLENIQQQACQQGLQQLFVLTTQTLHWFLEHGFQLAEYSQLPTERQASYNLERNAKILMIPLIENQNHQPSLGKQP